jgi:hypothetical protein
MVHLRRKAPKRGIIPLIDSTPSSILGVAKGYRRQILQQYPRCTGRAGPVAYGGTGAHCQPGLSHRCDVFAIFCRGVMGHDAYDQIRARLDDGRAADCAIADAMPSHGRVLRSRSSSIRKPMGHPHP